MKFQPAIHGTDSGRSARAGAQLSRENTLLTCGVALAFVFVTACLFLLG